MGGARICAKCQAWGSTRRASEWIFSRSGIYRDGFGVDVKAIWGWLPKAQNLAFHRFRNDLDATKNLLEKGWPAEGARPVYADDMLRAAVDLKHATLPC